MALKAIHANCSGCNTCLLACAIVNFREINPSRSLLRIEARFPEPGDYRIVLCDQCGECADSCPENAIFLEDGVYRVDSNKCTGCLICVDSCPQQVMFKHTDCDTPVKCNLCGECVRACPRDAIVRDETRGVSEPDRKPEGGLC
ncbi:MAG: 4Fe-4S binding protein [Deltaproteobacteria bacterium]|jgi:Fe-S-cluster-containing hydrogenase component 2